MKTNRVAVASVLCAAFALAAMVGRAAAQPSAPGAPPRASVPAQSPTAADAAALKAQVELLKGMLPDQAHVMSDVDYHFSNLWFAARQRNWPLAGFYLGEVRSHLNWAVRLRPVRKLSNGADLELKPVLEGLEATELGNTARAIRARDLRAFEAGYRGTMQQCYGCHMAAEKPYLKLRIPEAPASRMIDMRPDK